MNLGPDPEVIFDLVKGRVWRDHIWMRVDGTSVYRRVDDGRVEIDVHSTVAGWDEHGYFTQRVRNYSDKPIELKSVGVSTATCSSATSWAQRTTTIGPCSTAALSPLDGEPSSTMKWSSTWAATKRFIREFRDRGWSTVALS